LARQIDAQIREKIRSFTIHLELVEKLIDEPITLRELELETLKKLQKEE
jgi:hypothetical protein